MLTAPEARKRYTVRALSFLRDGLEIRGDLYLPAGEPRAHPTALLGHRFGGSTSDTAPYAAVLAERGIAACVFDFCGGSSGSRSGGDTRRMSVLTEVQDMEAVLDGLRRHPLVDENALFLMGESQGGMAAALLAARRSGDVRGLVLLYPALLIPDNARARFPRREDIPETSLMFGTPVGRIYFEDVWDMDVWTAIRGFPGRVLLLHGSGDAIVPLSYSRRAAEVLPRAELVVLEGAGHGFHGAERDAAAERAAAFMEDILPAADITRRTPAGPSAPLCPESPPCPGTDAPSPRPGSSAASG